MNTGLRDARSVTHPRSYSAASSACISSALSVTRSNYRHAFMHLLSLWVRRQIEHAAEDGRVVGHEGLMDAEDRYGAVLRRRR